MTKSSRYDFKYLGLITWAKVRCTSVGYTEKFLWFVSGLAQRALANVKGSSGRSKIAGALRLHLGHATCLILGSVNIVPVAV